MEAAFFDLDKTVISRSSMMAFAPAFRRAGLLRRRTVAQGAWTQLIYVRWGAGPRRLARIQQSVLAVTAGWSRDAVRDLVAANLAGAVEPIVYREALDRMAEHRAAGRVVVLVSAAPEEVVEPIGRWLGIDRVIASRAVVDGGGCYTGELQRYAYGPAKAALIRDLAQREGIDLAGSWAYTDSFTDVPMLEVVGHPVAVNADRGLRRVASMQGWAVERFEQTVGRSAATPTRTCPPSTPKRRVGALATVAMSVVAVVATTGGVTAWWVRRRPGPARLRLRRP